jgi:hypothetical protein
MKMFKPVKFQPFKPVRMPSFRTRSFRPVNPMTGETELNRLKRRKNEVKNERNYRIGRLYGNEYVSIVDKIAGERRLRNQYAPLISSYNMAIQNEKLYGRKI